MKLKCRTSLSSFVFSVGAGALGILLSGCTEQYSFEQDPVSQAQIYKEGEDPISGPPITVLPPPNSDLCTMNPEAAACKRDPLVTTPGVVSVLFTMNQIPQGAASLILANAIKYATPSANPKILFLKDSKTNGEDEGDSDYIRNTLLSGYNVDYRVIVVGGISPTEVAGKDLVIISNPGHPLSDSRTLETLNAFKGGVILMGDDLAHGSNFSMNAFTGLTYVNNGASMSCNGRSFYYDNQGGYKYQISLNSEFLPGIPAGAKSYEYGNDLDMTIASAGTQVLASAHAATGTCDIGNAPAVVRRPR